MLVRLAFLLLLNLSAALVAAPIAWPTPNQAIDEEITGTDLAIPQYVQPTVSGDPRSGLFGCVRSNGFQFHEGIDLKPLRREGGEPADPVFAAMDGVVRYINARAGESSYGRYIVIEHPGVTPAVYTLYAHLSRVASGISPGVTVRRGQTIATMGRSAGGYAIPRERAHLHFEIGLVLTREFQQWYDARKFGSRNEHGMWNGMNFMGVDPREYYIFHRDRERARKSTEPLDYFHYLRERAVAVKVRVVIGRTPDFALRYPSLVKGEIPIIPPPGWEIECYWTGLPLSLRPLTPLETVGERSGSVKIIEANREELVTHRAMSLIRRGTTNAPGKDLDDVIEKLFGTRR